MAMPKEPLYRRRHCDFCGKTVYEELTDEKVLDGGWTHVRSFEESDIEPVHISQNLQEIGLNGYACAACRKKIVDIIGPHIKAMRHDVELEEMLG